MAGSPTIAGIIDARTLSARRRARGLKGLPYEQRLEELRELRLDLLAAVDAIEKGLAVAAAVSHVTGRDL